MRPGLSQYQHFPRKAGGEAVSVAPPDALWDVISNIGGDNRYFALDSLWTIREAMDALVGGDGLKRVRSDPGTLRVGDRIDSWTILAVEPALRLALLFGMKAPGTGVLEFRLAPAGTGTHLAITAYWDPRGLAGWLYWKAMEPAHGLLFRRMTAEICRRAEEPRVATVQVA
jgi:hypothetical protein